MGFGNQWNDVNIGPYSTAFGYQTVASGVTSFATGNGTMASGQNSTALGDQVYARGFDSIALGTRITVSGNNSVGIGLDYNSNPFISANNVMSIMGGNVGVGTVAPSTTVDIFKTTSGAIKIVDGTQGAGKVLTSDANGVGTWQTPTGGGNSGVCNTGQVNYISKFTPNGSTLCNSRIYDDGNGISLGGASSNVIASGNNSVAGGVNTVASGWGSTAFGYGTTASGPFSTAFGIYTNANNQHSTAFGSNTTAIANFSTAFGTATTASGDYSTAFGYTTTASGDHSTAFGDQVVSSGPASTAFGYETIASGDYSTAFGVRTQASGINSIAFGRSTFARGDNSTSFGSSIILSNTATNSVGIGLDNIPRTVSAPNVMSIMGGNVGIGTTAPVHMLNIGGSNFGLTAGNASPNAGEIRFGDNSGWRFNIGRSKESSTTNTFNTGTTGVLLTVQDNGNVGIGTVNPRSKLQVETGDVYVSTQGRGIILRATNANTCHRVTVLGNGTMQTAPVTCP